MTKLQTVKLSECRIGDIIQTHGGRFQLVELRAADDTPRSREECGQGMRGNGFRSFGSRFLGNARRDVECAVPKSWREGPRGWTIQSNDFATWSREIA